MIQPVLSTEQFLNQRFEMPDSGQWAELIRGVPVFLEAPDVDHGTVVLNLSKMLASHFGAGAEGYACFDLGLKVESAPDTILFPAVSLYFEGPRFAHVDCDVSEVSPEIVVEIISTPDRRTRIEEKRALYQRWGVPTIWQIDLRHNTLETHCVGGAIERVAASDTFQPGPLLPGLIIPVADLFAIPEWYR